jgi:hypothetical protein
MDFTVLIIMYHVSLAIINVQLVNSNRINALPVLIIRLDYIIQRILVANANQIITIMALIQCVNNVHLLA